MQGLLVIIAGFLAAAALILTRHGSDRRIRRLPTLLLGVFLATCLLSSCINLPLSYNFLGGPYIRLGSLGLLACASFGLLASDLKAQIIIRYLYFVICAVGIVSVPYVLLRSQSFSRIGGVFSQADIFAVFLACGLLLGGYLLQKRTRRTWIIAAQVFLFALLLCTATRAALALIIVLYPLGQILGPRPWRSKQLIAYIICVVVLVAAGKSLLPARATDAQYAGESVSYRLDLQSAAVRASSHKPLLGYGPGNIADALDCRNLSAPALQKTCKDHYFFNSSHNIFLDRVLTVGWLGGLAYLGFVLIALYHGFRGTAEVRILAVCALLIALYYLTNVTSVTLELLLWVLLLQCLRTKPSRA